jgi:Protein of unknown function (DUF3618)
VTTPRTTEEIRSEIEAEREQLAHAVDNLRGELGVAAKVKAKLPLLAAGAAATGFVFAGGVGAFMRYLARRSREL